MDQSVNTVERTLKALELRKAGVGYQRIADTLGYSNASGAFKAVERALKLVKCEAATELMNLEIERLDAMLVAITPQIREGHLGAIDRALKISERRAKLLGLDAAAQVDLNQEVKHTFTLKIGERVVPIGDVSNRLALPDGAETHDSKGDRGAVQPVDEESLS